jgi:acetylornithine deacetylase
MTTPDLAAAILHSVDELFDDQLDFLARTVRCRSLRGHEAGIQTLIEAELQGRGWNVRRIPTLADMDDPRFSPGAIDYSGSWNLLAERGRPGDGRSLILNAHVDVVPAGPENDWADTPFSGKIVDGWMYGRGAGDMKAGMSALVFAMEALRRAGVEPAGAVQIHSVVDEELTGNGAASMLAAGLKADAVLIPEPTDEQLVRANSGVIKFRLTLRGRPAHPREPESGSSAIDLAIRLATRLRELEADWIAEKARHPGFEDIPNPVALTIGTIEGGEWIASLPSRCVMEGRVGFYPGDPVDMRRRAFEAFVQEVWRSDKAFSDGPAPQVEWVGVCQAAYEMERHGAAEAVLADARRSATGDPSPLPEYVMTCYLDSALYANHGGIPSLVYGPVTENIHGFDERVSLDSLKRVTGTIALFVAAWCGTRNLA